MGKLRRKRILKEFSLEEFFQKDGKTFICGRVLLENVAVGDCFNSLYKVQHVELGQDENGEFRQELFDCRNVSIQIEAIKFRGQFIDTVYSGHSADIILSGEDTKLIETPNDILGIVEYYFLDVGGVIAKAG